MSEPTRTVPPRPSVTPEIIEACAEELALQLDCDAYTLVKHYSHPMDGYEFARELENWAGWEVRSQNADDLEDMQHLIDAKVNAAEKQWFEDNNIQPRFRLARASPASRATALGSLKASTSTALHGIWSGQSSPTSTSWPRTPSGLSSLRTQNRRRQN